MDQTRRRDVICGLEVVVVVGDDDGDEQRSGDVGSAVESRHGQRMIAGGRKHGRVNGRSVNARGGQLNKEKGRWLVKDKIWASGIDKGSIGRKIR